MVSASDFGSQCPGFDSHWRENSDLLHEAFHNHLFIVLI